MTWRTEWSASSRSRCNVDAGFDLDAANQLELSTKIKFKTGLLRGR